MPDQPQPIVDLLTPQARLRLLRVDDFSLSGGIYRLELRHRHDQELSTVRLTLKDLIRVSTDLNREIKAAAGFH